MATAFVRESKRHQRLNTSHLVKILDLLKKHGYSGVDYYYLGLRLGLLPSTLDVIENENKGNVRNGLRKCLTAWLEQADNVKSVGVPTYEALIQALRDEEAIQVADGIEREIGILERSPSSPPSKRFSILGIQDLYEILDLLERHRYSGVSYYDLGLYLGLHQNTLNSIAADNRLDVDRCLRECLVAWLEQRDYVMSKGGPTYDTLIEALREMGENAVADGIERDLGGHILLPTADPISTEDIPAADGIPDTQNPLTNNAVNEWLRNTVQLTVKRVQMHGLPGSGKTCSQHLLLNKKPPEENNSTPIACRAVKATRISAHDDRMEIVDAKALLSSLAHDLKVAAAKQKEPPPEDHDAKSEEYSLKTNPTGTPKDTKSAKPPNTAETKDPVDEDDTEANKIINEIVEAIPNAEGKFDRNWVYFIDSGGQTAFQELLPLFTRASSFNIITIDLSKDINEKLEQNYRIKGKPLTQIAKNSAGDSKPFLYTNIQFLKDVLSSGSILQPYQAPQPIGSEENTSPDPPESEENTSPGLTTPEYPQYFVLGTHKDKAKQEVIEQYNKELSSLTSGSEKKGYHIIPAIENGDIIYAVDTMLKSPEREEEAKELCKIIHQNVSGDKIPIPVRWFAFELTLLEKAKGCSFLQIKEVLRAGERLKMTNDQTKKALEYLHNNTIILYYPQVLPDFVFVDPHPILDILSRLLALATYQIPREHLQYFLKKGKLSDREKKDLNLRGLFTRALLEKLKNDANFPKSDFIKLLLYLHIIVETDKPDEYFIPSALPPCPNSAPPTQQLVQKPNSPPQKPNIDPLQIIWHSSKNSREILPVPRGIFPLAVINLKKSQQFQFCFPPISSQYLRYRDAMSFLVHHQNAHIGTVHIIKKQRHIEINFEGNASKYCSLICEAVKEAIASSCKAINIKPDGYEFAFACPSTEGCYRIVTDENEKKVQCTLCPTPPTITGEEKYWRWFSQKSLIERYYQLFCCNSKHFKKWGYMFMLLFAVIIALASMTIAHFVVGKNASPITTGASPVQPHQYSTTGNPYSDGAGQLSINDVEMVKTVLNEAQFGPKNWVDLGLKLGLLMPRLNVIEGSGGDAYEHLRKTLEAWLEGKDKVTSRTWQTLIDAVEGTGDRAAADRIPEKLKSHYGITLQ